MEYPWRHPPLPPAQVNPNICPTCSISHFPFCPSPPSSFNQNPRFQSPSTYSLQRPFYEPYVDQRPWHRNPSLGDNNYDDGLASSGYDHIGAGYKRMRADEVDLGSAANDNHVNPPGISVDNERRLKLIRDHGGADSISGICVDVNQDTREYLPKSSVFERGPGGIDTVKRGRFDEPGFGVDDHFPTSYEANDLRDPRLSNYDRKGFYPEPDFNRHNYGEGYGSRFDQKISQSYRNEDLGRSNRYSLGTHDFPGDSLSANEAQYYHQTGWQGQSGSSLHQEQRSSFLMENRGPNHFSPQPYAIQNNVRLNHDIHYRGYSNDRRQSYGDTTLPHDGNRGPIGHHFPPTASQIDPQFMIKQGGHVPLFPGNTTISENNPAGAGRVSNVQSPLPASPPPPLSVDHQRHPLSDPHVLPSEAKSSSLFPISVTSSAPLPSSYAPFSEAHPLAQPYFQDKSHPHASTGSATELVSQRLSMNYSREGQRFHLISSNKPKSVDASHILKQPHRATRPDHIVVILRGLPGSGKSYLAKMMRDLEVENGGNPPRIHSMDDYFMTEVEKIEESDISKSSGSFRGKKPVVKKVMDYCYEPEMEEAYRSSMLKTFKKTLDEGAFPFVIVDDRNLRVADFAQFWATAKRSGYEVYLLEATYKDPAGCAARNVHGFTLNGIQKMAGQWEEAPSLYLKLDIKSLLRGDDLKENGIQEVDMDTEDGDSDGALHGSGEINSDHSIPVSHNYSPAGLLKADENWNAKRDHLREEVKELGRSKWSNDLEDDNANRTEGSKGNPNALSGLIKAYTKEGKSVHWGDQVGNTGFSIGSAKKVNISLVIGPGAGYNLKSNPLPEELVSPGNTGESKKHSVFQERIRAERDSFRAVFDKRRHRIGGLDLDEE